MVASDHIGAQAAQPAISDSHAYYMAELLFLRSLTPICLSLVSCQNVSVELTAKFVQAVDLCAFCEDS
jgi:hypothetical protein